MAEVQVAAAGALACQNDSYLKELQTQVISSEPVTHSLGQYGKKKTVNCYEVILADTVLFPEGGGQPSDKGTCNGVEVLNVIRHGGHVVHLLPVPFDKTQKVELVVDWKTRWDHMQQHSGQHLITALADQMYNFKTTSWNLGDKSSFIELDTAAVTEEQLELLEQEVNAKIRLCLPMYPTLYDGSDDHKLKEVRTRGLPDDHNGPVRVVTIEGIETNMCCGTHVSNLAHLQIIKLLGVEKGSKGKVNLVFLTGNRVLQYVGKCYEKEKIMTSVLKSGPDQHMVLLQKMQSSLKVVQKNARTLLRDIAILEGTKFKSNKQPYLFLHRKEGDNEFMNIIVNEINDQSVVAFLSTGDEKGSGLFLLSGPEEFIQEIQTQVSELIEAKGACKGCRFQGKANKLSKRHLVEQIIRDKIK